MPRFHRSVLLTCVCVLLPACGGGGGGDGGGAIQQFPTATVPDGSGTIAIQMAGIWEIRNPVIVETNSANPVLPLEGTQFRFDAAAIAEIGGLSVTPDALEVLLGAPLESYVNEITPSTVMYGVVVDQRATGGVRDEVALAGGANGPDSIAVEALTSIQQATEAEPTYTLSRYTLQRRTTTAPVQLPEQWERASFQDVFAGAFGGH